MGLQKNIMNNNAMSIKTFVLAKKLTQDELDSYFDDMADLIVELIDKYHSTTSTPDLEDLAAWYHNQSTLIYRDYTDFTPTILSQVLNNIEGRNGWVVPSDELDGGERFSVLIHEDYTPNIQDGKVIDIYTIEINEGTVNEANLVYENEEKETVIEEQKYETRDELRSILERWFEYVPNSSDRK